MSGSRREQVARVLGAPPLDVLVRRLGRWQGVLVLNYHRIGDPAGEPWDHTLWSASVEELDEQLRTLALEAEVIDPGGLPEAVHGARGRHVLLTFDDGYRDNHELALPLLRRHGLRATFFLATGFLDRPHAPWWDEIAWMLRRSELARLPPAPGLAGELSLAAGELEHTIATLVAHYKTLADADGLALLEWLAHASASGRCPPEQAQGLWMTWEMARELRDAGMSIGGHTVTHPLLARVPPERQREEILGCASRLVAELGEPLRWFAYPVGSPDAFTRATEALLREAGVELAFSFYGGYARPDHWNPMDVPRVHIGPGYPRALLRAALALPRRFARW
jgi:peptidoglycan/xylan/chitin deacetylase (PgdA/CDA1 family)